MDTAIAIRTSYNIALVFRDIKPIASYEQLNSLLPVATLYGNATSFEDFVTDYRNYYYAIIALSNGARYDIIIPTMNATVKGSHLQLPKRSAKKDADKSLEEVLYPSGTLRETPLPYIDIITEMKTNVVPLSQNVKNVSSALAKQKNENELPLDFYVFEEDLVSPSGGDDYLLFDILKTSFIRKKYEDSAKDLEKFLLTKRSVSVENRAHFYLGQSYYFVGRYSEAVVAFLSVKDEYLSLTKKWIDSALDFMELP